MMVKAITNTMVSILVMGVLSGCANRVYFGTSTRLAVDFSTDSAGIGYKSMQLAVVPPKGNGDGFSVLGRSDIDISLANIIVDEEFATGHAADCASRIGLEAITGADIAGDLVFGSYISVSILDINLGATNPFVGATIGYKRATATVVPIEDNQLRSVYAKNSISSYDHSAAHPNGTVTGGIRFIQEFATGQASINLASANIASLSKGKLTSPCDR